MIITFNPVHLVAGLIGGVLFLTANIDTHLTLKETTGYLLLFVIVTVTNPIFSHNGATPLLFINDIRITLEALVYGMILGLLIISVIMWFKIFNSVFDNEKILYILGKIFPKLALVVSMTLRFIPSFIKSFQEIKAVQKSLSKDKGRIKPYIEAFSAVITQSLENSIQLSDSMKARGYGLKPRTCYHSCKFTAYDLVYTAIFAVLYTISLAGIILNLTTFKCYPYISLSELNLFSTASYISYTILCVLPFLYSIKEGAKWKFSISKI